MKLTKELLNKLISECDAIVIGAGAGLSSAAGFEYGGKTFSDNFQYMHDFYGYNDMYSAGFHNFKSLEYFWGYWSKMIYLNRYSDNGKELYKRLYNLVKDKDYFVITTNVDHQFQKSGFDKNRLFYMQGDYGLFQCSKPCRQETFDNQEMVINMLNNIDEYHKIPTSLVPLCPYCGAPLTTNLRCDDNFVQDNGWYEAKNRYDNFINNHLNKKVIYLELGVGYSTPVWIKYPFMQHTYSNPNAIYIVCDMGEIYIPKEIENQSYEFNDDINKII